MSKTQPKPCPIPRDLKPGDVFILNDGTKRTVDHRTYESDNPYFLDGDIAVQEPGRNVFHKDGTEYQGADLFVVRIIRLKPDRDAAWLMKRADAMYSGPAYMVRRLRAIAKRLNGGVMP